MVLFWGIAEEIRHITCMMVEGTVLQYNIENEIIFLNQSARLPGQTNYANYADYTNLFRLLFVLYKI